jgi:hypothetical protein
MAQLDPERSLKGDSFGSVLPKIQTLAKSIATSVPSQRLASINAHCILSTFFTGPAQGNIKRRDKTKCYGIGAIIAAP